MTYWCLFRNNDSYDALRASMALNQRKLSKKGKVFLIRLSRNAVGTDLVVQDRQV